MFEWISFFVPIAEALIIGYVVAAALYMVLLFGITRLERRILVQESKATPIYTTLHAAAWCIAGFCGAYACSHFSPIAPYGTVGFPFCLAIALSVILLRGFRQLPGQMSPVALLLNLCGIFGGTTLALMKLHAFAALQG